MPMIAGPIRSVTWRTAVSTPLPPYRLLSPSRSSSASCTPVEAPEGTAARPSAPPERSTSASRVGFPRESRISRAVTWTISVICRVLPIEPQRCKLPAELRVVEFAREVGAGPLGSPNRQRPSPRRGQPLRRFPRGLPLRAAARQIHNGKVRRGRGAPRPQRRHLRSAEGLGERKVPRGGHRAAGAAQGRAVSEGTPEGDQGAQRRARQPTESDYLPAGQPRHGVLLPRRAAAVLPGPDRRGFSPAGAVHLRGAVLPVGRRNPDPPRAPIRSHPRDGLSKALHHQPRQRADPQFAVGQPLHSPGGQPLDDGKALPGQGDALLAAFRRGSDPRYPLYPQDDRRQLLLLHAGASTPAVVAQAAVSQDLQVSANRVPALRAPGSVRRADPQEPGRVRGIHGTHALRDGTHLPAEQDLREYRNLDADD